MDTRMNGFTRNVLLGFLGLILGLPAFPQTPVTVPTAVNAGLVLDAAGPKQRKSLNAIYLIACPNVGFGSGFLLDKGIMVTNLHVVATCSEQTLVEISTANKHVKFSRIIRDAGRDLAVLLPAEKLSNGLKLAAKDGPAPGTTVSTWGYPFGYNGISPLLSVGYVSGYREDTSNCKAVKHIVVNGAFNHGNSGGPLMISRDNEVIRVVVLTFNFYPRGIKQIIDNLSNEKYGLMWTVTNPDGSKQDVSEAKITAMVLNEFYEKTQVMIGEAISGSELAATIKEHSPELGATNSEPTSRSKKASVKENTH